MSSGTTPGLSSSWRHCRPGHSAKRLLSYATGCVGIACLLAGSGHSQVARAVSAGQMPGMQMPSGTHPMPGMKMPPEQAGGPPEFASGTAWQPASSPAWMWMEAFRAWRLMVHGDAFLTYNQQGGPRGAGKAESENWVMLMEQRSVGRGQLTFRQMLSAEALTIPHPGSPELFQTGETYHGHALVDHQHPHDVFGEIAAVYTLPITEKLSWFAYGGPAAEPALGPVAFAHRSSAAELPMAPLGHHLQDSTHISFGVATTGIELSRVKIEASAFNGREPDERRYNFDLGPLDSWSARLSLAPGRNWTAQYSYGHLVHPEALEPGNLNRQTASLAYNRPWADGYWTTTLVWGRNHKLAEGTTQNSYLLESAVNLRVRNYVFTRMELVDKDELFPNLPPPRFSYRIGAFTVGGTRDLLHAASGQIGLGAAVTFYHKPSVLDSLYGKNPLSVEIFLRFRPGRMK